ncbi:MAG: hydroxylamine reductase [Deltaproteobacteria bacterium]|jgi:hydroxylamine reductase|nr:hydroxylamine reductase [Deltaproteobacteria bacterium]
MFCRQCEWTQNGTGCLKRGTCGKSPEAAEAQDRLMLTLKGLACAASAARKGGRIFPEADRLITRGLYATMTNVDFDHDSLSRLATDSAEMRDAIGLPADAPAGARIGADADAEAAGPGPESDTPGSSLRETAVLGLKGMAAYLHHAAALGHEDDLCYEFTERLLARSLDPDPGTDEWLELALGTGGMNLRAMGLLDGAHTESFGIPVPSEVHLGHASGPAVLLSGHDLKELADLMDQAGDRTGSRAGCPEIRVYTHCEMLPSHGYPGLSRPELAGHYGTGWQNQERELFEFPGPAVFSGNCIQKPKDITRVFTTGAASWPGCRRLGRLPDGRTDFGPVLDMAEAMGGFKSAENGRKVLTGFNWRSVLALSEKIVGLIGKGKISRFVLIGGCDGAKPSRSYFTRLAGLLPQDTVILTLGCGKFRLLDLDLGDIEGIPRLLDMGQCNDSYSAVKVASALSEALAVPLDRLPLSLVVSWHEQKACAVLLTLLHLGIKNVRLGPSLPAFVNRSVLKVLTDNWGLKAIGNPEEDMSAMMRGQ